MKKPHKPGTPERMLEDLKKRQMHYTQCKGGPLALKEGDEIFNKLTRRIIHAYAKIHPQAFLGDIHMYGTQRREFKDGNTSAMRKYHGEEVCDFGCDFLIPMRDETLDELLREYNSVWNNASLKGSLLTKVIARIYSLGGQLLQWT